MLPVCGLQVIEKIGMLQCYFQVGIMKGLRDTIGKGYKGLARRGSSQQERTVF